MPGRRSTLAGGVASGDHASLPPRSGRLPPTSCTAIALHTSGLDRPGVKLRRRNAGRVRRQGVPVPPATSTRPCRRRRGPAARRTAAVDGFDQQPVYGWAVVGHRGQLQRGEPVDAGGRVGLLGGVSGLERVGEVLKRPGCDCSGGQRYPRLRRHDRRVRFVAADDLRAVAAADKRRPTAAANRPPTVPARPPGRCPSTSTTAPTWPSTHPSSATNRSRARR
jgi:hypothetical protein